MDGRPKRRNKTALSSFSGVLCNGLTSSDLLNLKLKRHVPCDLRDLA